MRATIVTVLLVTASAAQAGDFANCILDKATGVANDTAAQAVYQLCLQQHPGGFDGVAQGSDRGVLGFKSGAECTAKKAADTRSEEAARYVGIACRRLYDQSEISRFLDGKP